MKMRVTATGLPFTALPLLTWPDGVPLPPFRPELHPELAVPRLSDAEAAAAKHEAREPA